MTKNGWTEERRRKQAEAIKRWKPWENSTGPKTAQGKKLSRYNALKTGSYSSAMAYYNYGLKLNRAFLKIMNIAFITDSEILRKKNELLDKRSKSNT